MANPLKQLAGQTMIYGLSTILARIINFLFVPIYTRLLSPESYGVVTEFMAYIAVLQVMLVLGLETGCFRFANKEGVDTKKVYSSAFVTVFGVSAAFLALMIAFASPIASALGYAGYESCIMYMGGILALDAVTAILFAKLRQENKALKFAILKTVKIITETAANLVLFLWFPSHVDSAPWLLNFIPATPDFSYVIFSIFISCVVCGLMFIPDFLKLSFSLDPKLMKQMLAYSIPLMIAALPGVVNDFLDRILFRYFDTNADAWRSSLGLYQAAVKLAVIMNLFIQMFRYAAEPFFFRQSREKGSVKLYAEVQEYFTALVVDAVINHNVVEYKDDGTSMLSQKKLKKHLFSIGKEFEDYLVEEYDISKERAHKVMFVLNGIDNSRMETNIKKTLQQVYYQLWVTIKNKRDN